MADPTRARVLVLSGPSGAGKSRLSARLHAAHGWPIMRLDDFYKDGDDPSLPMSPALGIPDWDHPDSWDRGAAIDALERLVETGSTDTPVYDISTSARTGWTTVTARPDDLVIAEGIFAAETIRELAERGLLHAAYCVRRSPGRTFVYRLLRDLSERRKPPLTLIRRGLRLMRDEPRLVAQHVALGATPARPAEVESAVDPMARHSG
ncbi:uridine kinase family protein [Actinomycetota bacterium]